MTKPRVPDRPLTDELRPLRDDLADRLWRIELELMVLACKQSGLSASATPLANGMTRFTATLSPDCEGLARVSSAIDRARIKLECLP